MNAPQVALKPSNLENLRPLARKLFSRFAGREETKRDIQENPEVYIASLLILLDEQLSEPMAPRILVETVLFRTHVQKARRALNQD